MTIFIITHYVAPIFNIHAWINLHNVHRDICFKGDIMQVLAHLSINYSIILLQTVNWTINHSDQSFYLLQAIEALNAATRVKPVPPLFMLLGKTQMKAKEFKDAITSFDRALQLYVSFTNRKSVIFVVNCRNCHVLRGIFSKFLCYL